MECKICNENPNLILIQESGFGVSSLGKIIEANAKTFLCFKCSHCQTIPSIDLVEYYSNEYKTLSVSFDEDDLYGYEDGKPVYRNYYQAKTLINKLKNTYKFDINEGPMLDFGCGKSLVMKHLMEMIKKEDVFLFDVSRDYIQFWDSFMPHTQYSCYDLPKKWDGYFNLITSFFSFEHVADPMTELKKIRQLLKKNGFVYILVPNMYSENAADMLVIDHIQHYSESSMNLLFKICGFEMVEADHHSHAQGSIYIAKSISKNIDDDTTPVKSGSTIEKCMKIASFWKDLNASLHKFENDMKNSGVDTYFIIGAGFLGTYIYLQLQYPERLAGFIDSNEHKQKKGWQDKKVFAPGKIGGDTSKAILSGFNFIQNETILTSRLPEGIPAENIWSLNKIESEY
jgi:ubiquinone/menaquinone biosynthesis C-methylase UbiE